MPNISRASLSPKANDHRIYPGDYPRLDRPSNVIFAGIFALMRGLYYWNRNVDYIRTTTNFANGTNSVAVTQKSILTVLAEMFGLDRWQILNDNRTGESLPIAQGQNLNNYGGLMVYVARSGQTLYVLHHGLSTWNDGLTALTSVPVPFGGNPRHRCLEFFSTRANSLYAQLTGPLAADFFNGVNRVIFCGHSAGGATSQAVAHLFSQSHPNLNVQVQSFGSPRFANSEMAQAMNFPHSRVVFPGDPVPRLAPNAYSVPRIGIGLPGNTNVETLHYETFLYADRERPRFEWSNEPEAVSTVANALRAAALQGRGSFGIEHAIMSYASKINPGAFHERKPNQRVRDFTRSIEWVSNWCTKWEMQDYGFPAGDIPADPAPRWEVAVNG